MGKFGVMLKASIGVSALLLASCGGGGSSPAPTATATPTPTPTPTSTAPTPATYTKLADLQGDQTFQSAEVSYDINSAAGGGVNVFLNPAQQDFGSGTVVQYLSATDSLRLTAPGGAPVITINQGTPTNVGTGFRQWQITNGNIVDAITLYDSTQAQYSFIGTWAHVENGLAKYRLVTAGIPTKAGDFPTGNVTYNIALGGAVQGAGAVDAARSTGTMQINFAAKTGTLSVNLVSTTGASLGTVTVDITLAQSGNGFTGISTFGGVTGKFSGAFYGPQAGEASFGTALANGTVGYVGLGGGAKQ